MLCDTCIYYDCEDIHCSNCKMLQHFKTIDDYSNDVFYVVKRYSREQDAAKRVNYLNGGCNGT